MYNTRACKQKHIIYGSCIIILLYLLHFRGACSNGHKSQLCFLGKYFHNITRLPASIARTYTYIRIIYCILYILLLYLCDHSIARAEVHFSVARAFIVVGNSLSPLWISNIAEVLHIINIETHMCVILFRYMQVYIVVKYTYIRTSKSLVWTKIWRLMCILYTYYV